MPRRVAMVEELTGGGGERWRGVQQAAEGLLDRLEQTVLQEALRNSSVPPCPRSTGVELLGHREGEGGCDDVWEGEGGGVSSFAVSRGGGFL
jgi:hypothetical protein